ncbi:ActS/PrrB/RegB family redox-sensitive histidine kinase [Terrarubrum flagellatum]|uniref:ActS/PrrB/RegB family redox-sensitive histidine kinase n=1 Tax=Terrirubrum flagellatum TaxID=2895980 RepID=UPI003145196F
MTDVSEAGVFNGPFTRTDESPRLRLDTLVKLRWLAVAGQSAAVLITHLGLRFPVPLGWCFLVIAVSAWLNVALRIRYPLSVRVGENAAALLLGYDIVQLSALLYLTGGLQNPFAMLLLAPALISATTLPPRLTAALGVLTACLSGLLTIRHEPLPWFPGHTLALPASYVGGIWIAILLGIAFTGVYAWRVAQEARDLAQALAATELVLAREQHLSQLDGLAAAAAHELGTPLATIALVARELDKTVPKDAPYADDIAILRDQVARCRDILGKLTSLDHDTGDPLQTLTIQQLVEEIIEPLRSPEVTIDVTFNGVGDAPTCRRNPGMMYGLENLVENAVDFAAGRVAIEGRWSPAGVELTVRDDGPGFAPDVLMRLGEPYLRSRADGRRAKGGDEGGGLGLGLFIAKTLLERSGAALDMANVDPPDAGAVVTVAWPRAQFERRG